MFSSFCLSNFCLSNSYKLYGEVFRDFDTSGDHQIDAEEFLAFFARSVGGMSNAEFESMAGDML